MDMKSRIDPYKDKRSQLWRITTADAVGSLFWTKLCWDKVETVARIGRVPCCKVKTNLSIFIGMVSSPLTSQEYREIVRTET